MARKILKKWMPDPEKLKQNKALSFLGDVLHDPNLFHLNRHSVSVAFLFGLFCAFLPFPGQMVLGAFLAWYFRCNLPITIALIWISNPFTIGPIFFSTYKLGTWILGTPIDNFEIELSWEWVSNELAHIWQPLFVGSLLTGVVSGVLGYFAMQGFWRWSVARNWHLRKQKRLAAAQEQGKDNQE